MINLSKFSRMTFTELTSLPNAYIHTIYKLFVEDAIAREKRQKEEEARQKAEEQKANRNQQFAGNMRRSRDSQDVAQLRNMLSGQMNDNDFEDLLEVIEDGG